MKMVKDQKYLDKLRHSAAHLMAAAVLELYPEALPTIGPSIENGFYYDFDNLKISKADLPKIEKTMQALVKGWEGFKRKEVSLAEVKKQFKDNKYKIELANEFAKEGQKLSFYQSGDFIDLCRGGHIENPTKELKHFKLLSVAGAYWRGNEKNKMLTRIYGTAWPTKKELDNYLKQQEEAKKRDHRKLGPELDLFLIHEDIGKGLPLLTPKGTVIRNEIIKYERELERDSGFKEVWAPHIAKNNLYKRTGHWQHYRDVMYSPFGIDEETYVLKPMNCPHHYMIYASRPRSYKDLPIRLSEPGTCYRYEKSGELGGLTRVRALSIDDGHILMREDQIEEEFDLCIEMVLKMFKAFGLKDYYVRLSLADPTDAVKYIADEKTWQKAGQKLEKIIKNNKLKYETVQGEASFYGPKIDFMVKDVLGREWQMSTLQLDLFMAKKLNLTYIDKNGKKKHPAILHRGLTGSLERTMGILIEHFAGAFPVWLAPVQVKVLPITDRSLKYAQKVANKFHRENIRVEVDERNETLNAKIRNAQNEKVPYMLVVGDKEQKANKVAVRLRDGKDLGQMNLVKFTNLVKEKIETKALNLVQ
jgi:threonyl-tRNA synthetase